MHKCFYRRTEKSNFLLLFFSFEIFNRAKNGYCYWYIHSSHLMIGVEYHWNKKERIEKKRKKNIFISIIIILFHRKNHRTYTYNLNHKIIIFLRSISIMGIYKQNYQDCAEISFTYDNSIIDDRKFLTWPFFLVVS